MWAPFLYFYVTIVLQNLAKLDYSRGGAMIKV